MNPHPNLSSYLVRPHLPYRTKAWPGFSTKMLRVHRYHPHPRLLSRSLMALSIWTVLAFCVNYLLGTPTRSQASIVSTPSLLEQATGVRPTAALASAKSVKQLPGGPSGQLLPPGTLAPDYSFANSYIKGQCTWYVAGRRQVPSNWGNANQWYYHAVASGWSVGTTPAVGAIAWTAAGRYGHVAVVENVSADGKSAYIAEMNYSGPYIKSKRWVSSTSFKYIY